MRQQAKAARQALALCEAELPARARMRAVRDGVALRAAGLPPLVAAAFRSRLHLNPELEAEK